MEYHARRDVLEKERTYRLTTEGFAIEDGKGPPRVWRYGEIRVVRLRFFPSRFQTNRFECLVSVGGGETVKIVNEFCRGLMSFEDRSAQYRAFVIELCKRIAAAGGATEFRAGREAGVFYAELVFCGLMFVALAWVLWLTGGTWRLLVWIKLALLVFYFPTLIRYARRNRPNRFDPQTPPLAVLPTIAARGGV